MDDLKVPEEINTQEKSKGLKYGEVYPAWTFNAHNSTVKHGCFSGLYHSVWNTTKTNTQGVGGPWYETELDAYIALRFQKEKDYKKALAEIDKKIAALGEEKSCAGLTK